MPAGCSFQAGIVSGELPPAEDQPPVHRLTNLKDDRASAWLTGTARGLAATAGRALWAAWVALASLAVIPRIWYLWHLSVPAGRYHHAPEYRAPRLIAFTAFVAAILLFGKVKGAAIRLANRVMLALVLRAVRRYALPIDELRRMDELPEGQLVSLVGWVRGRSYLPSSPDGKPCVGVALECETRVVRRWPVTRRPRAYLPSFLFAFPFTQRYPRLVERLHDFDLADEQGNKIPVLAAGARVIADGTVTPMGREPDERAFLASLDLPFDVEPLRRGLCAIHDGDPVLVVGFKTTIREGNQPRPAMASGPPRPLLLYPITLSPPRTTR